ncbi:uncharacterized protein BCR38DRAFT_490252 [Pseudomassariella vexata]|uniref:Uncharacterized protein n=1 Tax=Pseudomassariella vexata TaxID=1141098 RepID=A0A1Y2DF43_9PEZI|nr:uncharacterized protein BCR38DRAFT_490252 [Pseudomassariella vexata]ORY57285.1 hypothetical protein BCR38DRAFT_490252 [Pseudomassariella vexata]
MLLTRARAAPVLRGFHARRFISTLDSNRYIKVFPNAALDGSHVLAYLDTPTPPRLIIGTTTELPPTPRSFTENCEIYPILNEVLAKWVSQDPSVQSRAQAFVSSAGAGFSHQQRRPRQKSGLGTDKGAGGGGGGRGGHFMHVSDLRKVPDFGRICEPEDMLGSVEVNEQGHIVGEFQPSGTYRIVTNDGILGLGDFLTQKLIERLQQEERKG